MSALKPINVFYPLAIYFPVFETVIMDI